ncbi:hypothetical protein ACVWW4_004321 [Bradyrhizobium sp. LB7.1]
MNDYDALRDYLMRHKQAEFVLTYEQIEEIIGAALPRAANRASWWDSLRSPDLKMPQREAHASPRASWQCECRMARACGSRSGRATGGGRGEAKESQLAASSRTSVSSRIAASASMGSPKAKPCAYSQPIW